jgi:hypothetical protein
LCFNDFMLRLQSQTSRYHLTNFQSANVLILTPKYSLTQFLVRAVFTNSYLTAVPSNITSSLSPCSTTTDTFLKWNLTSLVLRLWVICLHFISFTINQTN